MAVIRPPSITTWPSSRTPSGVITEPLVTAMVGWPTPTLYPYPGARDDDGADVHRDPRHRPRPVGRHRCRSCRPRRRDHGDLPRARLLPRGRPRRARLVPPRVGRRAAGVLRPARGRQGEHRQDRVAALPGLGAGRRGADGPPHGLPRAARRGHREPAVRARTSSRPTSDSTVRTSGSPSRCCPGSAGLVNEFQSRMGDVADRLGEVLSLGLGLAPDPPARPVRRAPPLARPS